MSKVIIDPTLRARLQGLEQTTLFYDEDGNLLGSFRPSTSLMSLTVPFSDEEIERRRNETGGSSLEEFWKRMGQR